jgi:hypothetical protein
MNLLRPLLNPASPIGLFFGWIVWSSAFVSLYGAQGLGCSLGWASARIGTMNSLTLALALLWLAHLGLLGWLALRAWRAGPRGHESSDVQGFVHFGNRISLASAAVATAWLGFPILLLDPCA